MSVSPASIPLPAPQNSKATTPETHHLQAPPSSPQDQTFSLGAGRAVSTEIIGKTKIYLEALRAKILSHHKDPLDQPPFTENKSYLDCPHDPK